MNESIEMSAFRYWVFMTILKTKKLYLFFSIPLNVMFGGCKLFILPPFSRSHWQTAQISLTALLKLHLNLGVESIMWLADVTHTTLVIFPLHISLQVFKNSFIMIDISDHRTWTCPKPSSCQCGSGRPLWERVCVSAVALSFPGSPLVSEPRDSGVFRVCW